MKQRETIIKWFGLSFPLLLSFSNLTTNVRYMFPEWGRVVNTILRNSYLNSIEMEVVIEIELTFFGAKEARKFHWNGVCKLIEWVCSLLLNGLVRWFGKETKWSLIVVFSLKLQFLWFDFFVDSKKWSFSWDISNTPIVRDLKRMFKNDSQLWTSTRKDRNRKYRKRRFRTLKYRKSTSTISTINWSKLKT